MGPARKRTRRGDRSILNEGARLPDWARALLAWLRQLPQVRSRVGRQEIITALQALIRVLESQFESDPVPTERSTSSGRGEIPPLPDFPRRA